MDAQQNRLGYVWCWWFLLFFEPPFDIRRAFLKKKTEKRRNRSPQLRPERIRRGNIWQPSYILCLEFVVFGTEGPCCWNLSCWQVFSLYIWKEWKEHGTLARVFLSHSVRGEKVSGESRGLMANNSAPMGHTVCLLVAVVVLLYRKEAIDDVLGVYFGRSHFVRCGCPAHKLMLVRARPVVPLVCTALVCASIYTAMAFRPP